MSEIAIVSARKARLHQWADGGNSGAQKALEIANSPNNFLSTVQIGITLVGIFAGAFSGATLSEELAGYFKGVPSVAPYAEAISLGIVVTCITLLSLVVGELVPKRLALSNAERIASFVAVPMDWLTRVCYPLVISLSAITDLAIRVLAVKPSAEPPVTEAEIRVLVEQGTEAGVFEEREEEMVASVLRLGDRRVSAMMTPRPNIVWLDKNAEPEEILKVVTDSPHVLYPVADGELDKIIGIADSKSILWSWAQNGSIDLQSLVTQPLYVPENKTALELIESFRQGSTYIAIVVDEFGGLQGLVSIHDVMESIVGDMPLSGGPGKWDITQREDGSWLMDGGIPTDELKEILELKELPGEEGDFETLAGFILFKLERIPEAGDHFDFEGWRFEVVDMDKNRIDKVLIAPAQEESKSGETTS